jgi:hypothetical protein
VNEANAEAVVVGNTVVIVVADDSPALRNRACALAADKFCEPSPSTTTTTTDCTGRRSKTLGKPETPKLAKQLGNTSARLGVPICELGSMKVIVASLPYVVVFAAVRH